MNKIVIYEMKKAFTRR